ncbi:hypothetical protein PMIN06_002839 [Paraphaeosphaeria minitans]|uniref:RING-type domain-containing protein n=1 Tax=Paraphaeosphaeria minitans TaxID=565426 RepID=A0A9P6GE83_9PLEO|nr:hypothetical protein PMIN01_09568 [Paraphaeosphaeria minitans]
MNSTYNKMTRPYKLPRWTEPISADDRTCYVCLRKFGVADEEDDPACEALRPNCGHFIGSTCFLRLVQSGSPMVCFCQTPYPRAEPTFLRKLARLAMWRLFLAEVWVFEPIRSYFDGPFPARAALIEHFSRQLARGDELFDMEIADGVFIIGQFPVALLLTIVMPTCLLFQVIAVVLGALPLGTYGKAWIPNGFSGYQGANFSWLIDLVCSFLMALLAGRICQDVMMDEDDQDPPVGYVHLVWQLLISSMRRLIFPVFHIFFSRIHYLILQLSDYGLILLYCVNLLLAIHIGLYKVLSSRSFYKP